VNLRLDCRSTPNLRLSRMLDLWRWHFGFSFYRPGLWGLRLGRRNMAGLGLRCWSMLDVWRFRLDLLFHLHFGSRFRSGHRFRMRFRHCAWLRPGGTSLRRFYFPAGFWSRHGRWSGLRERRGCRCWLLVCNRRFRVVRSQRSLGCSFAGRQVIGCLGRRTSSRLVPLRFRGSRSCRRSWSQQIRRSSFWRHLRRNISAGRLLGYR
jgi:hypothetical protein